MRCSLFDVCVPVVYKIWMKVKAQSHSHVCQTTADKMYSFSDRPLYSWVCRWFLENCPLTKAKNQYVAWHSFRLSASQIPTLDILKLSRGTLVHSFKIKVYPCTPRHEKAWRSGNTPQRNSYAQTNSHLHDQVALLPSKSGITLVTPPGMELRSPAHSVVIITKEMYLRTATRVMSSWSL